MKKNIYIITVLILLTACNNDSGRNITENEEDQKTKDSIEQENEKDKKIADPGEKKYNSEMDADVERISFAEPNDTIELGRINMTVEKINIISVTNIRHPELLDMISDYGKDDAFSYIQIEYTLENTGDESLNFWEPIESIVFNTKEQIEISENEIDIGGYSGPPGTIHGKVKDELVTGIIIGKSDPKDIQDIKLVTGRVSDEEGYKLIDSQKAEYELNK